MQKDYRDDPEHGHGAGALAIAWLLLFALAAGVIGWLYITGNQKGVVAGIPGVTAPIPPMLAAVPEPEPQPYAAQAMPEPAPEPEMAAPEPAPAQTAEEPAPEPAPAMEPEPAPAMEPEPAPAQAEAETALPPAAEAAAEPPPEPEPAIMPEPEKAAEPAPPPEPAKEEPKKAEPAKSESAKAEAPAKPAPKPAPAQAAVTPTPPQTDHTAQAVEPEKPAVETNLAALPEPHLAPAPDPGLIERGREGPLPVIGADGRKPWQVYARPFDESDKRPRIAVVVTGLGLSGAATETAIQQLPGSVTLGFSPYAKNLEQWMNLARAAGHEVLLDLPMEPIDYPQQDPGPYTLLTSIDPKQNLFKMQWLLSRGTGYVGVTNQMGSRFTASGTDLTPVIKSIKSRGLLFLDSRSSEQSVAAKLAKDADMPWAVNNRFIDGEASRPAIDARLAEVEEIAKKTGFAVAMGSAYPVTIERIAAWLPEAEKSGFAIAPVSAVANKQALN